MENVKNPFKNAGTVLLILGVVDIGIMIYCIKNQISYSSSFNIFAVIAGIFLLKRGLKTAQIVSWLSVFFVCTFAVMLLAFPVFYPVNLLITQIKLNPVVMLSTIIFTLFFIVILVWLHLQLSSPSSLEYFKKAGYKISFPKSAAYLALAFTILSCSLFAFIFNGDSAEKAQALAKEQLGPNYNYHISNINWSNNSGSAVVTAYNSNEIRSVQVEW